MLANGATWDMETGWQSSPTLLQQLCRMRGVRGCLRVHRCQTGQPRANARPRASKSQIGSLEIGKRADIVIRLPDLVEAQPALDSVQGLVLSPRAKSVHMALVEGGIVIRNGTHTMLDQQHVYAIPRESARRILKRTEMRAPSTWPFIHECAP
jgi:hypothetical protein